MFFYVFSHLGEFLHTCITQENFRALNMAARWYTTEEVTVINLPFDVNESEGSDFKGSEE